MADATTTALRHQDPEKMDDAALAQEAQAHVAKTAAVQLVAELLHKLRTTLPSWWSQSFVRETWPAVVRMTWLKERADLRQKITTGLTGLAPKAARNKAPEFQASLIDSVIEDGDVTVNQFEDAFDVTDIATYAPIAEIWHKFRERFPWDQDTPPNQELIAWLFEQLLSSQSSLGGHSRKPVLTSLALRTAIPGKVWHTRMPLEVRVAIDDLRFQREKAKPGDPFHAIHDLSVATPGIITANIPLRELGRVLDAAEKALGFGSAGARGSVASGGAPAVSVPAPPAVPSGTSMGARPANVSGGPGAPGAPPPPPGVPVTSGGPPPPPPASGAAGAPPAGAAQPNAPAAEGPTTKRPGAEEDFAFDDDPDDTAAETEKARRRREQAAQPAKR